MRLGTLNLLHGMALPQAEPGGERLGPVLHDLDADVVGLQEVDVRQPRSGGVDQAELAANALGARWWRFVPTVLGTPGVRGWRAAAPDGQGWDGPTYGVALVSRRPVREWRVRRFAAAPGRLPLLVPAPGGRPRAVLVPDEPRVAVAAVVEGERGPFTVVTTHLSFVPGFNVHQLRSIARWAADLPRPAFLLGDLNMPPPLPARLTGWQPLVRAATYPSYSPRVQLDHVLADGLGSRGLLGGAVRRLAVSDHCSVVVDIDA